MPYILFHAFRISKNYCFRWRLTITTASSETRFKIETSLLDDLSGARDSSASIPGVSETRFNVEVSLHMLLDGSMQTESDVTMNQVYSRLVFFSVIK